MSLCGTCKAETTRIRTVWTESGSAHDECPQCAPQSFEKFTDPSDKKIWMGYEAHPNEYVKAADGGYDRKPEYRSEQEQRLASETEEERTERIRAEAEKRSTRRTRGMNRAELTAALHKAEQFANWLMTSSAQGSDIN